jgi:protein-S-isoprenylcysteine O-methyltransferase Ste14
METHSLVVIAAFCILGFSMLIIGATISRKGINFLGKPTIDKYFFYTGKLSLFGSLLLFLCKAIFPGMGLIRVPPALAWTAAVLFCLAVIFFIISFGNLGTAIRVGLPEQETVLKTNGLFRFSRNPLYMSVYLICLASLLYYPNQVNLVLVAYGIFVHHRIILGEEKFLAEKFGSRWEEYRHRVRRYL